MSLQRSLRIVNNNVLRIATRAMSGEYGSGVGKGGGGGGAIREAGGSFGKKEAVEEEMYFRRIQAQQLKELKKGMKQEVEFHQQQIDIHKEALDRHKERLSNLKKHVEKHN